MQRTLLESYNCPLKTSKYLKDIENPKVGADPFLFTQGGWQSYSNSLAANGITLVPIEENLVDKVWFDKPEASSEKYFIQNAF